MNDIIRYLIAIVIGYLLGSIPSGQIVGALYGGVDLSRYGSGKTGATNALRTLGWGAAVAVFVGDFLKGVAAVLVARALFPASNAQYLAEVLSGFAAVLGHNWSVYIKFKGGRGVVVSFAVFVMLCWPAALIAAAFTIAIIAISRIVSLASIVGAGISLLLLWAFVTWGHYPVQILIYGVLGAVLIWIRHIDNMQRLLAGTERKIGQKAQPL